jgi:uncharacterized membrane protein YkvA (DUF1232 family)
VRFGRKRPAEPEAAALTGEIEVVEPSSRKPRVMARFAGLMLRVPRYLRLAYGLARDQRLTSGQRALVIGGAAYLVSPIDPIPGFIPVVGQLDDLAVLLLSLRRALRGCPPALAAEHLERAGLSLLMIDADLQTVRATAVWVAVKTGRAVGWAAGHLARAGARRLDDALGRWRSRGSHGG